jgi:hypothetical protein
MEAHRLHSDALVRAVAGVPFSRLHQDLLAIDQQAGYCYSMNLCGARIWELIQKPAPVSAICAVLGTEFGVERDKCLQDVLDFLDTLAEAGLIEISDGA